MSMLALDVRRAAELIEEGRQVAERLGDAGGVRWLGAQQNTFAFHRGRWHEALPRIEQFIAECEPGSPHYLEGAQRFCRAHIREARGDVEGAMVDYRASLALGREVRDPQVILPALGALVRALDVQAVKTEARSLAAEVAELAAAHPAEAAFFLVFDFLLAPVVREFEPELRKVLERVPPLRLPG